MADPLSITASIITLIQASIQVTVLIKQFRNEASAVDATLTGLLDDVERFKRVLESMRETVDQSDINSNLQSTGHTGNHWKNLARSLNDGTDTLQKLHELLDGINKKTSVLDTPRKLLRLKSASEQIMHYREQIQSSHTALQLSLSTIILWNQVAFQKSTEMIPDKIVPTLDKLYEEFRTFGALLNAKIEKLQLAAVDPTDLENHKLQYMNNLWECVRSAADVVSSASTTLNTDSSDKVSVRYGSDFGDIFIRDANEPMLRWFASNTVYEYEDVEAPLPAPSEASTGDALTEDNSDTDSDLENDLIRSLFKEGMKRKEQGDLTGAVRHFRNCLTRFSSKTSYAPLTATQSLTACGVSKVDLLEYLTDCYCLLGSWGKAKSTMAEKLAITERQVGKKDVVYLKDTMKLAEIMMMNQDYVEAHLQARRSLRGFRRLGENGQASHENCLAFLIQICQLEGKEDEEEAYTALLVGHVRGALRAIPQFQSALLSPDAVQPQSLSTLDAQAESIVGTSTPKQSQELSLQPHEATQKNFSQDDLHAASSSLSHRPSGSDQDTKLKTKRISNVEPIAMEVLKDALLQYQDDDISEKKPLFPPTPPLPAPGMAEESEETESAEYLEEDENDASWNRATQSAIHPPSMTASTSTAVDTFGRVQDNKYYAPLSSFIDGRSYPIEVMEFISMLSRSSREDKIKRQRQEAMANVDFLETYCRLTYGTRPDYSTSGGLAGFTCTVSINSQQWCTVSGYASQSQAVDAAAAKVCWEYMTTPEMVMVMEILGKPNRSSDKEVYVPYLDGSHIAIPDDTPLQQAPGITITQPGQDTIDLRSVPNTGASDARSVERSRLRRYASNPSMLTKQDTGQSLVGKFTSKSYAALKVGKTHQRAAASLPKLPSIYEESNSSDLFLEAATADGGSPASLRVSRCPVCNDALSEMTCDALSHVSKCIIEQYGTIDVSQRPQDGQIQSPGALVSRPSSSSATMTSTEGLWACDRCKPDALQYLSEEICSFCFEPRHINTPSSLNGFERDLYYHYIPQTSTVCLPRDRSEHRIRRKVVLLGDTLCGKTWLASRWCKGQPLSRSEDKASNKFIKTIEMEGWQVELAVWDCVGKDKNETTRRLSYDNAHMALICFDISDRDSFENVHFMWKSEVEKYLPGVPKVLVGCKKELRNDMQLLQAWLLSQETLPISPYAGNDLAIRMDALAYFETSAVDSKGLPELFDYVAKALLREPLHQRNRRLQAPLSKSDNKLKP